MVENRRPADTRLPVIVELEVRQGTPPEEILRLAGRWKALGFQADLTYAPVRLRPPQERRSRLEQAGLQAVMVRGLLDPRQTGALEREAQVRKIWRDARLEPFVAQKVRPIRSRRPKARRAKPSKRKARTSKRRKPKPGSPRPPEPAKRPQPGAEEAPQLRWPPRRKPRATVDCTRQGSAIGTLESVRTYLGVDLIWAAGTKGAGIVVGMVDGGITAVGRPAQAGQGQVRKIPNVVGGWPANWGTTAEGWGEHGNMTATDVLGMAPEAHLWDIRIFEAQTGTPATAFSALVSNAIAGYRAAIDNHAANGVPHILNNSWGLRDRQNGLDYATDPESPFALMVEEALDDGILVLFAAGNCGKRCPEAACGGADRGPGSSILGPNGHPRVMTVGAANLYEQWCGYTSQGQAVLPPHAAKPDFCSIARFAGYFPHANPALRDFDGGTSAASAIAAGVVALLKRKRAGLTQGDAKTALANTAKDIRAPGFDVDSGAGIIQAKAAFDTL